MKTLFPLLAVLALGWTALAQGLPDSPKPRFLILATMGQAAAIADTITTIDALGRGYQELDPLARPFTELPRPAYLAASSAMQFGLDLTCWKMMHSENSFFRRFWYLPLTAQIGISAILARHNANLR